MRLLRIDNTSILNTIKKELTNKEIKDLDKCINSLTYKNKYQLNSVIDLLSHIIILQGKKEDNRYEISQKTFYNIIGEINYNKWNKIHKDTLDEDFNMTYFKYNINGVTLFDKLLPLILKRTKRGYSFSESNYEISTFEFNDILLNKVQYHCYYADIDTLELTKKQADILFNVKNIDDGDIIINSELDKESINNYIQTNKDIFSEYSIGELKDKLNLKDFNEVIRNIYEISKIQYILKDYLKSKNKRVKQYYTKAFNGRYYTWITSLSKKARNVILKGYIEYDVENFAPTFLYKTYELISKTNKDFISLPLIESYIKDKKETRIKLAQEISGKEIPSEEDIKIAKTILVSGFFGANLKHKKEAINLDKKVISAIPNIFNNLGNKTYWNNYIKSDYIKKLNDDKIILFNYLSTYIKDNYYNKEDNKITTFGMDLYFTSFNPNKAIAHFYQSFESQVWLKGNIDKLRNRSTNKLNDIFILHDAIIIRKETSIKMNKPTIILNGKKVHIELNISKEVIK